MHTEELQASGAARGAQVECCTSGQNSLTSEKADATGGIPEGQVQFGRVDIVSVHPVDDAAQAAVTGFGCLSCRSQVLQWQQ